MNAAQVNAFGKHLSDRAAEFLDGYVVVGFVAGSNKPVIITQTNGDPKTSMALNSLLISAVQQVNQINNENE